MKSEVTRVFRELTSSLYWENRSSASSCVKGTHHQPRIKLQEILWRVLKRGGGGGGQEDGGGGGGKGGG